MSTRSSPEKTARLVRAGRSCCSAWLRRLRLLRQRIGTQLQLHELRHIALADAFVMERRAVAGARPHAAALPAAVRVVDAPVDELGEEAHRVVDYEVVNLEVF